MQTLKDGRVILFSGEVTPVLCSCGRLYQPEIDSDSSRCPRQSCRKLNVHHAVEVKPIVDFTFELYNKPLRDLPWDPAYVEERHVDATKVENATSVEGAGSGFRRIRFIDESGQGTLY